MATPVADGVRALAEAAAASAGLVIEDVTVAPAGRRRVLRVVVDLPEGAVGGVPMDSVAAAAQALSQALDDDDAMGGPPYVLEVSSPGADRPLVQRRHWSRARGRLVLVRLEGGGQLTGRLTEVGDAGPVVAGEVVPWARVTGGRVELEFAPPGAPDVDDAPDDEDRRDGPAGEVG